MPRKDFGVVRDKFARDDGLPVMLGNGRRRKSGQFGYLLTVCSKRPPAPF
jgi:hypothetical protein